ncbi:hypothetical protein BN8_00026 [Fibrisoma limi BUZ 3]|uniref:EamA domain-containing protein n=1 Tax=Fibrisoma limi BUZ 3 TaxID=1185876 RepID=I2GB46_9BACT|nr:hypothetical protein [Fibrisoma limi]CCH51118.1 hypothetical protein BN8_00026 [Fibrisoma limi BUZ 3]
MAIRYKWLLLLVVLELISLLADYLIKKASLQPGLSGWKALLMGGIVYGSTALGWFYMMRSYKLFTIGALHSVGVIALSVLLSLIVFKEKMSMGEFVGLGLGLASIVLLLRFQE